MSTPTTQRTGAVAGLALLCLLALPAGPAAGQSLLGTAGLGFPVEPVDARSRGMGSLGVGLFGPSLLPTDPAVAQALTVPMITATYQPSWVTATSEGLDREHQASRFPLMGVAYPVGGTGGMATLTFTGFMDQRWEVSAVDTLALAGNAVRITDTFESRGGISTLRLGWAQQVTDGLSVATTLGTHLGDVSRTFTRSFDSTTVGADVQPYRNEGRWRFTGPTVSAGVSWDPTALVRVAGTVTWSGTLTAAAQDDTEGPDQEFDVPTEFRVGASGSLSPRLGVNVGASYADWSGGDGALASETTAGASWGFGGGLEWDGPILAGRDFPIRIGYRRSELPFAFQGSDATESAFSLGLGMNLLEAEELPLARLDFALESGERDAGLLVESFTRATVTLRVAGR